LKVTKHFHDPISIFDGLLYRPPTRNDIPQYEEVQRILKEEIVNPLRQHHYVRADKVMKLRRLLQKLGSVKGLTNEEKGELRVVCYIDFKRLYNECFNGPFQFLIRSRRVSSLPAVTNAQSGTVFEIELWARSLSPSAFC
jgi:hypothetical protein